MIDAARQAADHPAVPTCSRMRAIASALKAAMVQSPFSPAILCTKLEDQLRAVGRMHHLGVEHRGVIAALLVGGDGEGRVLAGRLDGKSPAAVSSRGRHGSSTPDICRRSARRPSNSAQGSLISTSARPNSQRGRLPPCRPAGCTASAGHSRWRGSARRCRTPPAARAGSPRGSRCPARRRRSRRGLSFLKAASADWNGCTSE
jgi:hypothetical protein